MNNEYKCIVCFDKVQKVKVRSLPRAESLLKPNFESPERSIIPLKPLSNKRKIVPK